MNIADVHQRKNIDDTPPSGNDRDESFVLELKKGKAERSLADTEFLADLREIDAFSRYQIAAIECIPLAFQQ